MRWSLSGLLLLGSIVTDAAAREERIRRMDFPDAATTAAEIHLQQSELGAERYDKVFVLTMGGPVAFGITEALFSRREKRAEPGMDALRDLLQGFDVGAHLREQVPAVLREPNLPALARATVVRDAAPKPGQREPERHDLQRVLKLKVEYFLTLDYHLLRIRGTAMVQALDAGSKDKPDYFQRFWYDIEAPKARGFGTKADARYLAYWASLGRAGLTQRLRAGLDGVLAMLAYDLPRTERLGFRRGKKQHPFLDTPFQSYGVVEREAEGRRWLRLRNGYLVDQQAK